MKFMAVFTATEHDKYDRTNFIGGYGGAPAITPTVHVFEFSVEGGEGLLQHELNGLAWEVGSKYNPRYTIALVSVIKME